MIQQRSDLALHPPQGVRIEAVQSPGRNVMRKGLPPGTAAHLIAWPILCGLALTFAPTNSRADGPKDPPEPTWTAEQRRHWSFIPPARPEPPPVEGKSWVRNPIDAFIL